MQHFYLQVLSKAKVYKLKAFHGEIEDSKSVSKRQAVLARMNYKLRVGKRKPKPERQNRFIERTHISKVAVKTSRLDNYQQMKEQIREIKAGKFKDMTLDQILFILLQRRVGDRLLRCCSPLSAFKSDEVPSPTVKSYANYTTSGYAASKLPKLNKRGKMSLAEADADIAKKSKNEE